MKNTRSEDANQTAFRVVQESLADKPTRKPPAKKRPTAKKAAKKR